MNQLQNTNSPVILIADDDRDILSIIETILQEDGYQTLTASDGEQAVMLVQTHAVQLLILDIMMPKMNGLQAATQIRRLTNAPILMLSAKGEQSDRVIGLNMGAVMSFLHASILCCAAICHLAPPQTIQAVFCNIMS